MVRSSHEGSLARHLVELYLMPLHFGEVKLLWYLTTQHYLLDKRLQGVTVMRTDTGTLGHCCLLFLTFSSFREVILSLDYDISLICNA